MKNRLFRRVIPAVLTVILSACSQSPQTRIIGEWQGTDPSGQTATLTFNRDHSMRFERGETTRKGNWDIKHCGTPVEMDLVFADSGEHTSRIPLILRFTEGDKLEMRTASETRYRPTRFSEEDDANQVVLVRRR